VRKCLEALNCKHHHEGIAQARNHIRKKSRKKCNNLPPPDRPPLRPDVTISLPQTVLLCDPMSVILTTFLPQTVLLCDPMLATGGSANCAIKCLIDEGIPEDKIFFINLLCAPEGRKKVHAMFPKITIISAEEDECLNEEKFLVPGLGDFGDRYYATN
jgi:uracil phosphoribosyltransferase